MRDYSQGSIQSFEMLDARTEGGLYRVRARVSVRIEDFRAYVRKAAEGEAAMGPGLFAQMATQSRQQETAQGLIEDRVLRPILTGEAVRIEVGRPVPYSEAGLQVPGLSVSDTTFAVVFRPTAFLAPDFFANLRNVLRNTATRMEQAADPGRQHQSITVQEGEFHVTVCPRGSETNRLCNIFILKSIDKKKIMELFKEIAGTTANGSMDPRSRNYAKIKAEIQGNAGNILFDSTLSENSYSRFNILMAQDRWGRFNVIHNFPLVTQRLGNEGGIVVREAVQAIILLKLDEPTLREAQRMVIRYEQGRR